MTTLLSTTLLMSSIFIFMNHPLSMGLILLIQTTLISLITGNLNYNFWFSYILFLVMVGGMLILFMYMTSIASNEKFKMNMKVICTIILPMITIVYLENFVTETSMINNDMQMNNTNNLVNLSMNKFINYPLNMILVFMMIYLLLALVATVKISSLKNGPLRQMFN
uniref:NADH-ubiquinone oxidoreductase chain 6 n=1 Tax=Adelium sp. NCS-2009 TaxID=590155 RepID=D1G5Q8_9CUCU|nr:NADH dehydrogenase subunit 6 [Adelium sp. NCS-2009]ACM45073.1 NADH dehydrogenase subunit 6 [Adelium sp. NCS-2009]